MRHTIETAFERWMRGDPELDSRKAGLVRFDCDIMLHSYATCEDGRLDRTIQRLMFIEVKTFGAFPTAAQLDTLSLFSQVLRNRRTNIHRQKRGKHAEDHVPMAKAFSKIQNRDVCLKMYGGHLLQLSGDDPLNSESMTWDANPPHWSGKTIDIDALRKILRFELDPDTLLPVDDRRRSGPFQRQRKKQPLLFDRLASD
jgi:hypothetical protein